MGKRGSVSWGFGKRNEILDTAFVAGSSWVFHWEEFTATWSSKASNWVVFWKLFHPRVRWVIIFPCFIYQKCCGIMKTGCQFLLDFFFWSPSSTFSHYLNMSDEINIRIFCLRLFFGVVCGKVRSSLTFKSIKQNIDLHVHFRLLKLCFFWVNLMCFISVIFVKEKLRLFLGIVFF